MNLFILLIAMMLFAAPAYAVNDSREGYAMPNFRELSQTSMLMGGVDVTKGDALDEYIRLSYCPLYQEAFNNDIEWHKLKTAVLTRIQDKTENYRILYQVGAILKLGRYDFATESFPFEKDTAMNNVGSVVLHSASQYAPYCEVKTPPNIFPVQVNLRLIQPITVNRLRVSVDTLKTILAVMQNQKNEERNIYARIRFRVTDAPGLVMSGTQVMRSELRGEVNAIDFFYDHALTMPVEGILGYN